MKDKYIKKDAVFNIIMVFVFVAFVPAVNSQFEINDIDVILSYGDGDIIDWSTGDYIVNLGVYRWLLLDGTAMVTAYRNGEYANMTHRGTRGLGIAGGENDEIDSIGLHEQMHVTFDTPRCLTFFEVRSLFKESYDGSPVMEGGDVDLYLDGILVYHYHVVGEEQIGTGNGVVNISDININVDKVVFYVNQSEPYAAYSEFAVAKLGLSSGYISFVIPFSGVDSFKSMDVDDDINDEYAIDADCNPATGYELYKDGDGSSTAVTSTDGDNDGKIDHFIDIDGDGVPDRYWDPDDGILTDIYSLTINIVGGGYVVKNPDQMTYMPGTVVELTAISNVEYVFDHWDGDLTGGTNPDTIVMDGNKNVTTYFTQEGYTLTVNVSPVGSGSVSVVPDLPYHYNDVVTLTAIPNTGYAFDHWSGNLTGSDNPDTVTMDGDKTVTSHFIQEEYTLSIDVYPIGSGSVSVDSPGPYYYNDVVELDTIPNTSYVFDHWDGDLTGGTNPDTIVMDDDKSVTAYFTQGGYGGYTLNIHIVGNGSVDITPIDPLYATIELTAIADPCWKFDYWDDDLTGDDNPDVLVMDSNKSVTAYFTDQYVLDTTVIGNGSIIKDPDQATYTYGTVVELTAVPDSSNWIFSHWSDHLTGSNNPEFLTIDDDKSVSAIFNNVPPVAGFIYTPLQPTVRDTVMFINASFDFDGVVSWFWDFGDGNNSTEQNPTHQYDEGTFNITLNVTDYHGGTDEISKQITVTSPPEVTDVTLKASDPLDTEPDFGWENFTCNVTDNVAVDEVKLVLTYPDTHIEEFLMDKDGDIYSYNTTLSDHGNYTYHIWANDTSNNQAESTPDIFSLPPNWDVNMDGCGEFWDLVAISFEWGNTGSNGWIREDVDNLGMVEFWDLVEVSFHWGETWW